MDKKVKILLISSGDTNGAYEALYRIGKEFTKCGHIVKLLVKSKTKPDDFIVQYTDKKKEAFLHRIFFRINSIFLSVLKGSNLKYTDEYNYLSKDEGSKNICPKQVIDLIGFTPEFIYTGMTDGFINTTDLLKLYQFTSAEVYNITVDMNHFTGGCHYAWSCEGYINGCTNSCPAIVNKKYKSISKRNFDLKLKNVSEGNFKILAGSGWTLKQAKESKIYKHQSVIHNLNGFIDLNVFNYKNRGLARRVFDLEDDKFYILTGCQNSNDKRKGFEFLLESLKILSTRLTLEESKRIEVLIVSRGFSDSYEEIPFTKKRIDFINDYRLLSLLYQSASVFVNSSIEDSGPLMVSEAMACGTPVVGFDMGIVNNLVITNKNGYKAELKNSMDLTFGIQQVFNLSKMEYAKYSLNAFQTVRDFSSVESGMKIFDMIHKS